MRNALAFAAAAVIAVAAVGFYLNWFTVRPTKAEDGHKSYTFDVNTDKIADDARKAQHKFTEHDTEKVRRDHEVDAQHAPARPDY
jgi:hypothetical protein